jgi:aryl sulfotransferase
MRPQQKIYRSALIDSARWASYNHRPGDIFVCASPKCGTTWMQTIAASLLWPDGNFPGAVIEIAPWFDARRIFDFDKLSARLEAQSHRRFIKTHTPADGIPIFDTASYIVVARDGRDAFVSFVNHRKNLRDDLIERLNTDAMAQSVDPVVKFRGDIHGFFERWITDAPPLRYLASWWDLRDEPNVLLVHYNDLQADLEREMRRVAGFLDIDIPEALWAGVVERCTFERMREEAEKIGDFQRLFEGGAESFLFKGANGRWRGVLTEGELQRYQDRVQELLAPEAANWLEHGSLVTGWRP